MTFKAAVRKLLKENLKAPSRSRRALELRERPEAPQVAPTIQPVSWGAGRCCRECGGTASAELCAKCQVPLSVQILNVELLCQSRTQGVLRAGEDFDTAVLRSHRLDEEYGPDAQLVAADLLAHDAIYLAAAGNLVPRLVPYLRQLEAEVAQLRGELAQKESLCCQLS